MIQPVFEMEKILGEEKDVFEQIFEVENLKHQAILDRDGRTLEKLCRGQELLLEKISFLEGRREKVISDYRRKAGLDDLPGPVSLRDIIRSMDEDSTHHLLRIGMDLKGLLQKLSELKDTNTRLIRDNLEFYNMILSGLKSSSCIETGYGRDGRQGSLMASSFFKTTA